MLSRGPQVVIFGCGSAGIRAHQSMVRRRKIVGFADNDAKRHGTQFEGLPVLPPDKLRDMPEVRIVIASMYHHDIARQLVVGLGIAESRIELAPEFALDGGAVGLSGWLRRRGLPGRRTDWGAWRLRNLEGGRRAFVIGNGPSLRMGDLDRLAERGELCLAANKIFLAFPRTRWRPDYYAVQDPDTPRQAGREIESLVACRTFVAENLASLLPPRAGRVYFRALQPPPPPALPGFSDNVMLGVYGGRTITYTLLQLAAWLGCREAVLLGVDCDYVTGPVFEHEQHRGMKAYVFGEQTQQNYFVPDYHRPGETILKPDLDYQQCAYAAARVHCHDAGRMRILNATRGGKLEAFERVDFDTLVPP